MILFSLILGCRSQDIKLGEPLPDFSLIDANKNSESYDTSISFSDYEGQVSVWYFGHAT